MARKKKKKQTTKANEEPKRALVPDKLASPFADALRGVSLEKERGDRREAPSSGVAAPKKGPKPPPRAKQPKPVPVPPRRGPKDSLEGYSYEDRAAFQQAFSNVAPLGSGRRKLDKGGERPKTVARAPEPIEDAVARARLARLVAGGIRFQIERDEDWVQGHRAGQSGPLRDLRGGNAGAEAQLDLHGEREAQAMSRLVMFLREARLRGRRIVRVVHGKGSHSEGGAGVLGDAVVRAISDGAAAPYVQAFMTCSRAQGGAGALLIRVEL